MSADRRKNIREYGLGDPTPYLDGPPRCKGVALDLPPCPNCGCATMYEIEQSVKSHPLIRGGVGIGVYISCPACPFATPMMITAFDINDRRH